MTINLSFKQYIFGVVIMLSVVFISTNIYAQCPASVDTLATYNIVLADIKTQIPVVKKWLQTNPYSGYPALMTKICSVMDKIKFIGDAPSLLKINHENLLIHNREDSDPITNEDEIDSGKLEQAMVEAWVDKNTGLLTNLPHNPPTFKDITTPR